MRGPPAPPRLGDGGDRPDIDAADEPTIAALLTSTKVSADANERIAQAMDHEAQATIDATSPIGLAARRDTQHEAAQYGFKVCFSLPPA